MANVTRATGFTPVAYLNGAPWTGGGNWYYIAANNTDPFAIGDLVSSSGSGDANGVPGIALSATTVAFRGVIVSMGGTKYAGTLGDPNNLNIVKIPATKTQAYYALVVDDPNVVFEAQELATGTALTAADIGANIPFYYAAAATYSNVSGSLINNVGSATTSTLDLKLLGLAQGASGQNVFGHSATWRVLLNNHELRSGTTGV